MEELLKGKYILDCCCGSRMFWFDKRNPSVLFADIRDLESELCDGSILKVKPDIVADFRKMPFKDETFKMVVFDPPHLKNLAQSTWMAQKLRTSGNKRYELFCIALAWLWSV
jgi:ubiquinone/menaquinone biosynthesis C-methylase UbiE